MDKGKSKNTTKTVDISKVGLHPRMASVSIEDFKKWCEKHNFVGDLEGALKSHKAKIAKRK